MSFTYLHKNFSLNHKHGTFYFNLADVHSFNVTSRKGNYDIEIKLCHASEAYWEVLYYANAHKLHKAVRHLKNGIRRANQMMEKMDKDDFKVESLS